MDFDQERWNQLSFKNFNLLVNKGGFMNGNSGLISSLFDLSFSELVTTKIVKYF